jgi:dTDP-4-dehydrorhamnose reductase/UDP-glucose 4-epimerase
MAEPGILVVGRNGFLAGEFLQALPAGAVRAVSHGELGRPDLLDGIRTVIGFAKHPLAGSDEYEPAAMDQELAVARRIGERPIAYVMLSSRKVYAPDDAPLAETSALGPGDAYGRNKLRVEQRLAKLLGERLTILRLANIFGNERLPGRRTFLAMVLNRLKDENRIRYDMSPFVERDFLPADVLAGLLHRFVAEPPGGVWNVGSGIGLPTGRLALWIMEGFGGGELLIESHEEKDRFVLDIARLETRFGRPCSLDDLRERCLTLGRDLRTA